MRKLVILAILTVPICGFLSQSFAEPPLLLPPIGTELIIAGLEHSEALLKSGKGHFKLYSAAYFEKKKEIVDEKKEKDLKTGSDRVIQRTRLVEELQFAFSREHSYFKYLDGEVISDGKIQLIIASPDQISMVSGNPFPPFPLDPRDWGLWYNRQKLSDYLRQQKKVRVIGSEKVDGIPCYILETPDPKVQEATVKFWVAPEGGFRLIQSLHETKTRKNTVKIEWQRYQTGEGNDIWFPKHGIALLTKEGEKTPSRNEVEITDFQPNIDVSYLFVLQISLDAKIMNTEIGKFTTFKEISWQKLETSTKE